VSCTVCGKEKRCAAYVRVSTQDQARKGFSLPEQRELVLKKAQELGYCPGCVDVFEDAHTGAEMERPGWNRLRQGVQAGRYDIIVCLCPDRLGRTTVGMLLAYEELSAWGAKVEYVHVHVDEATPEGRLLLQISAVFSDYERRKIASRIAAGKERKLRQTGRLPHHVRLYGYRFNRDTDLLEVDEKEAAVVRLMFRWAAYGADGDGGQPAACGEPLTPADICRRLNAMGIPRADGKTPWHRSTVTRMLRREAYYTGVFWTYRWRDKSRGIPRPPDARYAVPIEPLVDEGTWRAANERLNGRRTSTRGEERPPFLLRGLVSCGACGRPLLTASARPRGKLFRYYRCPGAEPRGTLAAGSGENGPAPNASGGTGSAASSCPGRYWNADAVERIVWHVVYRELAEQGGAFIARLARAERDGDGGNGAEAEALAARLAAKYRALLKESPAPVRRRIVESLVTYVRLHYPRGIVVGGPLTPQRFEMASP